MANNKKGAKPLPAAEPAAPPLDGELLAKHNQQLAAMNQQQQAVIQQYGDGLPWNADHYEAEIRLELRRGCESFLRAGRYLVVARECAAHGEWLAMLGRLGLEPRQAQRMMETARRLANASHATHLLQAAGTPHKLIELLSLPEDQFKELATEGATGDLEIDDLADMTRDELRAAVRRARDEVEKRDEQIDTLKQERTQARREWVKADPDTRLQKLRGAVRKAADAVLLPISSTDDTRGLNGAIVALLEDEEVDPAAQADYLAGIFQELIGCISVVRDNLPVAVPILEPRVPKAGRK